MEEYYEFDLCDNKINKGNEGGCYQSLLNKVIAFAVVV
jgi:hypothetical protein